MDKNRLENYILGSVVVIKLRDAHLEAVALVQNIENDDLGQNWG